MPKLPSLNPRRIVKALLRAGFYIYHQKGGHIHLRSQIKNNLRVTVPYHAHFDLPPSVLKNILKQADLSLKEFLGHL